MGMPHPSTKAIANMSAFPMNIKTTNSENQDLLLLSKGHYGEYNDSNLQAAVRYIIAQHLGLPADSTLLNLSVLIEKVAKAVVEYCREELTANDCRQMRHLLCRFSVDDQRGFAELFHMLAIKLVAASDGERLYDLPPVQEDLKDGLQQYLAWLKWFEELEIADDVFWTDPAGVHGGVYRLSGKYSVYPYETRCSIETPMGPIIEVERTDLSPVPASK